jgi:hypothetical protein
MFFQQGNGAQPNNNNMSKIAFWSFLVMSILQVVSNILRFSDITYDTPTRKRINREVSHQSEYPELMDLFPLIGVVAMFVVVKLAMKNFNRINPNV